MIVREIKDPKYREQVFATFDHYNDYKDTRSWCVGNAPELVERLDREHKEYWAKRRP